jgi:hypothetical protein
VQDGAGDLFEDVDVTPVDVGGGALVGAGAYYGLVEPITASLSLLRPR